MKNDKKIIFLNIQILRMILSFNIVVMHCIGNKNQNRLIYFICITGSIYYVPIFFLISFYFSYKTFIQRNIDKLKERLLRIIIPYIIWPLILWLKFNIINYIKGIEVKNKYKDLFYQLLIGKPFHPIFWFQFCLLFWSIIFIIIIFAFKNTYNYIMIIVLLIILFLNLSGLTPLVLENYSFMISRSIGDIFYKITYIMSGFYFGSKSILEKKFSVKIKIIIISIIGVFIFNKSMNKRNNNYIAIQLIINIIFLSFSFLPFDLIKNKIIISFIKQITSFTGGIYYLHWEIKYRTFNNSNLIQKADFMSCVINYLMCYIFCFFSFKLFKNTKLKYLFI